MRVIDVFAGAAGGWSLGLHWAGFRTVAACEIDPARRAAFAHNNPGVLMYDDIRHISAARLRRDLGFLPEVIAGSPPCQDASTANAKGKGIEGERTGLFTEYVRLVREIRPRWCCAENVIGLRTRGADWFLDALEALGYTCWPFNMGAVHAGAPHLRRRLWFIAADTDQIGRRTGSLQAGRARRQPQGEASDDPDPDRNAEPDVSVDGEMGGRLGLPCDTDEAGLALGQGERCDTRAQLAALERAVGARGMRWNGGAAGHYRVVTRLSAGLAATRVPGDGGHTINGLRACIAAYGDSVVPQIACAIGNAIRRTEDLIREGAAA